MAITRKLPVARLNEIPLGRTKAFRFGLAQGIAYNDGGTIKAFINKCTHMGGPVELTHAQGKPVLRCRWHEAEFDPSSGEALSGQAPSGTMLTPIPLTLEGDQLFATLELPPDPFAF